MWERERKTKSFFFNSCFFPNFRLHVVKTRDLDICVFFIYRLLAGVSLFPSLSRCLVVVARYLFSLSLSLARFVVQSEKSVKVFQKLALAAAGCWLSLYYSPPRARVKKAAAAAAAAG
jgi:hypothetical protein